MKIFPPDFTIAALAPAGPVSEELVNGGAEALRKLGAKVKLMPHIHSASSPHRFLAAGDQERSADLTAAWHDPEVSMIWAIRGGYGCARLLESLNWHELAQRRIPAGGFSDITALHWAMTAKNCGIAMALPMFSFLMDADEFTLKELARNFTDSDIPHYTLPALRKGDICALPLPGNLTVAASLCGTPYFPDTTGRVIILEEIGEASPYRIDRLLNQLYLAGTFQRAAGVVFGYFTNCGDNDSLMAVLDDFAAKVNIPVFYGMKYGHEQPFVSIRCDRPVRITNAD